MVLTMLHLKMVWNPFQTHIYRYRYIEGVSGLIVPILLLVSPN